MNPGTIVGYGDSKKGKKPKKKPVVRLPVSKGSSKDSQSLAVPRPTFDAPNWDTTKYEDQEAPPMLFPIPPPTEEELKARAEEARRVDEELGLLAEGGDEDEPGKEEGTQPDIQAISDDSMDEEGDEMHKVAKIAVGNKGSHDLIVAKKSKRVKHPTKEELGLGESPGINHAAAPLDEIKAIFERDSSPDDLVKNRELQTPSQKRAGADKPNKDQTDSWLPKKLANTSNNSNTQQVQEGEDEEEEEQDDDKSESTVAGGVLEQVYEGKLHPWGCNPGWENPA